MALHQVTVKKGIASERQLQVDGVPALQTTQVGPSQRLWHDVRIEGAATLRYHCQAAPIDSHAAAEPQSPRRRSVLDSEPARAGFDNLADRAHDSREHLRNL